MDEYNFTNEYLKPSETESLQIETDYNECKDKVCMTDSVQVTETEKEPTVTVEEKFYGVNKPYRIFIRAKISHDKNKN